MEGSVQGIITLTEVEYVANQNISPLIRHEAEFGP